jgi:hypothetical protein
VTVKLRDRIVARRERKERERYLRKKAQDDAAGWGTDPQKAMHDAGQRIAELNKPYDTHGW